MHLKPILSLIASLLLSMNLVIAQEQLIVFVENGSSSSEHFMSAVFDSVKSYTEKENIELITKNITETGAPHDITITPSMVYQNPLGRSLYQGRYTTMDRLINFIRTVKNEPKKDEANLKQNILIWNNERAMIALPVKVTPLTGHLADDFNQSDFIQESEQNVIKEISYAKLSPQINLPRHARAFYMDFNPWMSKDSILHISGAIYSMFSCVDPVFKTQVPFTGPWAEREQLFILAGKRLEQEAIKQLSNLSHGDAFKAISDTTAKPSWSALGLSLPAAAKTALPDSIEISNLPQHWNFSSPLSNNSPILQFHFGSPVDHYAGEVRDMRMQLTLASDSSLLNTKGHVVVNTSSITMGDEGLDDHIFNDYLNIFSYPNATYNFKIIDAPSKWKPDSIQPITLTGDFEMIGIKTTITATGTAVLVMSNNKTPQLKIHGNFSLPLLDVFGIEGPDGPSPAKDQLYFQLNFLLEPNESVIQMHDNLYEAPVKEIKVDTSTIESEQEEFVHWQARNKIYKAKGSFEDWKFNRLDIKKKRLETLNAEIKINMNSVKEKSKLLVKHLKGEHFFDVDEFPEATILVNNVKQESKKGHYSANGTATIKGVSEDFKINFAVVDQKNLTIEGTFKVNREAHNIGTNKKSKNISKTVEINFKTSLGQHLNEN